MSEILINWVNNDVRVKEEVHLENVGQRFRYFRSFSLTQTHSSSGYLFGCIMKYYEVSDYKTPPIRKTKSLDVSQRNYAALQEWD